MQPGGKIPERTFPAHGFVDGLLGDLARAQGHQEGGIRTPRQSTVDLDVGGVEKFDGIIDTVEGQFIRAHGCPSGSIGRPHQRQSGRPDATTASA